MRGPRSPSTRRASTLDARTGWVRDCHGDLHLRNVVLIGGRADAVRRHRVQRGAGLHRRRLRPRLPPDGPVATRPARACQRGVERLARRDRAISRACRCCRCSSRAAPPSAPRPAPRPPRCRRDERQRVDLQALTHGYLDLAQRLLSPRPARVVAIGGLSGSGKSTLARALAPHVGPGARRRPRQERRTPQAPVRRVAPDPARSGRLHARHLAAGVRAGRRTHRTRGRWAGMAPSWTRCSPRSTIATPSRVAPTPPGCPSRDCGSRRPKRCGSTAPRIAGPMRPTRQPRSSVVSGIS